MQHFATASAPTPASLGLRTGRGHSATDTSPATGWRAWEVLSRAHGFNVSRESSADGTRQWVRNSVGKVTVFRSRDRADEACEKANAEADDGTTLRLKLQDLRALLKAHESPNAICVCESCQAIRASLVVATGSTA